MAKPCISWLKISIQSHPVAVRPGKLMAKNLVNIQYTGEAIAMPIKAFLSSVPGLKSAVPSAVRKPCTASTKHSVQLNIKPMVVMRAALTSKPADTHAKPDQQGKMPSASPIARKPPVRASHTMKAPQQISAIDTSQGKKFGPTPP